MNDSSKARTGKAYKTSTLYMHRAHAEYSLVTSFQVTGFRVSAHT